MMPTPNLPLTFIVALILALLSVGCGKPDPADRYRRPEDVVDFGRLYQQNCAGCHGAEGELGPAPPLADPLFQAIVSDEQLHQTIADGRAGTLMPAFAKSQGGSLTSEQVQILIAGIRKKWKTGSFSTRDLPPYQVSVADPAGLKDADAEAGKALFETSCAHCHGDAGTGGGAGAINEPALARLMSDIVLRRLIITGRPDLKMPNYVALGQKSHAGEAFDSQQISDIAAYVRKLQIPSKIASRSATDPSPSID
ncbi:MAG: c-type cytochrome [Blastopirellula sp. JB062]